MMTDEAVKKLLDNDNELFEYILKKDSEWEYCVDYTNYKYWSVTTLFFEYKYINEDEEDASFDFMLVINKSIFNSKSQDYYWLDQAMGLPKNTTLEEKQIIKLRLTYLFWYVKNKFDTWVNNETSELDEVEKSSSTRIEVWAYPNSTVDQIQFKIKK